MDLLQGIFRRKLVESPARFDVFKSRVAELSWGRDDLPKSLDTLFHAIDDLAKAEIDYYYKRRKAWARMSGICRAIAWVFGSIGVLIPLAGSLNSFSPYLNPNLGYLFLAIAGAFLAANSLFNWTEGHIRYLKAQLAIESLVTSYRIAWCRNLATFDSGAPDPQGSFELIADYAAALHEAISAESGEWGEAILTELKKYQRHAKRGEEG